MFSGQILALTILMMVFLDRECLGSLLAVSIIFWLHMHELNVSQVQDRPFCKTICDLELIAGIWSPKFSESPINIFFLIFFMSQNLLEISHQNQQCLENEILKTYLLYSELLEFLQSPFEQIQYLDNFHLNSLQKIHHH